MKVCVKVELAAPAEDKHLYEMNLAAAQMTNDRDSIQVSVEDEIPSIMLAVFTMRKARQIDVVDKIGRVFSLYMEDYRTQSICFPKKPRNGSRIGFDP